MSLRDVNPYLAAPATASLEDLDEGYRPLIFVKVTDRKVMLVKLISVTLKHACTYTPTQISIMKVTDREVT